MISRKNELVILSLGSNQGDRKKALESAINLIDLRFVKTSTIHETEALIPPGSPKSWNLKFLNVVISGYTSKSPLELLSYIKDIERKIGREEIYKRWSPRIIDIDILFYGDKVVMQDCIQIPHSELHKRNFVLRPLNEILPNYVHPTLNSTITELLRELND